MPSRLLTLRAVCRLLAVSADEVWAWVEAGTFPAPVVLPDGRDRWSAVAVAAWQAELGRARRRRRGRAVALDDLKPLARDILQVLREAGGEWVVKREIAARVGNDGGSESGAFKRALKQLKAADGLVEADPQQGFRAVGPQGEGPGAGPCEGP